jgi:hypothetical protein
MATKALNLPVNPDLVWDYQIPDESEQTEAFRRWYIARVLSRGRADDLKAVGFSTIHAYLSILDLPAEIRNFWEWYFSLPEAQARYGTLNATAN